MAVLGMETTSGDFEVIDICFAGLPPLAAPSSHASNQLPTPRQPLGTSMNGVKGKGKVEEEGKMEVDGEEEDEDKKKVMIEEEEVWVGIVSGISAGAADVPEDLRAQLLAEWLMGEAGGVEVSRVLPSARQVINLPRRRSGGSVRLIHILKRTLRIKFDRTNSKAPKSLVSFSPVTPSPHLFDPLQSISNLVVTDTILPSTPHTLPKS